MFAESAPGLVGMPGGRAQMYNMMRGELRDAEYFQHVYMALGRAQKLDRLLLQNFPRAEDGSLDWTVFENGPPDFLVEFMRRLNKLAAKTMPKLIRAQQDLGMPAWEAVPACPPDPAAAGRFLYEPERWGVEGPRHQESLRKRLRFKTAALLDPIDSGAAGSPGGTNPRLTQVPPTEENPAGYTWTFPKACPPQQSLGEDLRPPVQPQY